MSCCSAFMSTFRLVQKGSPPRLRARLSSRGPCVRARIRLVSNFIGRKFQSYWTVVNVHLRRTLMTTPVTTQGPATQGMSTQQGYAPGFPPALGIEQYLGQPQQYGGLPQQFSMPSPYPGQQQFPGQQAFGQHAFG